jgi:RNA polymerase sigma factor (sigma-70 family)
MTNTGPNSVTVWIEELRTESREDAWQRLWERYFPSLVVHVQTRFRKMTRGVADAEDVALSAFLDLCQGTAAGHFPDLDSRDDLWKLLLTIADRKAQKWQRRERAKKRGGNSVVQESALPSIEPLCDGILAKVVSTEPTPEDRAIMTEEFQQLFDALADDSHRVVALLKLEGHSNEEIALELDCGLRTVERKLELIRKRWFSKGCA